MKAKAVAFDLDDTLLRDDRTVSDYTVSVLKRAAEKGIHVIPASGRAMHSMQAMVDRIGCAAAYIACNGAELWSPQHELLDRVTMDVPLAKEVAHFGKEEHVCAQTYKDRCFYYSMKGKWADAYAVSSLLEGVYVGDLEAYLHEPTSKILMSDEPEHIAAMREKAKKQFAGRLNVASSKAYFLEFNPLGADKGSALRRCGERFGFAPEEIVAFGDSLNDLTMLLTAGTGVCVANGRDDVKVQVKYICGTNEQDGVAHFIENELLEDHVL